MIRIESNTDNLFSLLLFIVFVINTFSHLTDAFIQNDFQGNEKLHRGRRLGELNQQPCRFEPVEDTSVPVDTCCQVFIHRYHRINIPTHLALTAVVVLNFAMIMVLYSSSVHVYLLLSR